MTKTIKWGKRSITGVSDPWRHHPPNGSQTIREGRGGRRSQNFPLNERHDFHHCFCCPGNQGQPSGEYSKRTPCLSLLSDPLPCTPFPDHPLPPKPVPNFLRCHHHPSGLLLKTSKAQLIFPSFNPVLSTMFFSTAAFWGSSHHTHLPCQGAPRTNDWLQSTRMASTLPDVPLGKRK